MQWNQPFSYQSYPKTVTPLPVPQIVGEGDVTKITFPDGSVQFYFIPTIKQNNLPSQYSVRNPYGSLISCPTYVDVWFVRSITDPQANLNISVPSGYFFNQFPSTNIGECPPCSPPNYCMNTCPPAYHEYTQKFHHDAWTSTTDIHYFYPSLRQAKFFQYCEETQTEIPFPNFGVNSGYNRSCHCESSSQQKPVINDHNCHPKVLHFKSSDSCMSVDDERSESGQRKNKRYCQKSMKNKTDHICQCKKEIRDTSEKLVTTVPEQATGNAAKSDRETQTEESKCSKKQKSKAGNTKSKLKKKDSSSESESCCYYYGRYTCR